jgi:hypothetical protein
MNIHLLIRDHYQTGVVNFGPHSYLVNNTAVARNRHPRTGHVQVIRDSETECLAVRHTSDLNGGRRLYRGPIEPVAVASRLHICSVQTSCSQVNVSKVDFETVVTVHCWLVPLSTLSEPLSAAFPAVMNGAFGSMTGDGFLVLASMTA